MEISVLVKPNAKIEKIAKIGKNSFSAKVNAPTKENKANYRLILLLSKYFSVAKTQISIVKGLHSRIKIIRIIPL